MSVTGGTGNDTIDVRFGAQFDETSTVGTVAVNGGAGNDTITYTGQAPATLHGGDGDDAITDDAGAAVQVYGDDGNDTLREGGFVEAEASASLYGGAGNDTFSTGDPDYATYISGGDGTDTLDLKDSEQGPAGPTLNLNGQGPAGGTGGIGSLSLDGTLEDVYDPTGQYGGEIIGNAAGNVIDAPEASAVMGMGGNDTITLGYGQTVNGGDGNDTLVAGPDSQNDTVSGGAGTDLVDYTAATAGQTVYLDGSHPSTGDITFDGTVEQVYGSNYNDVIYGTSGNNALFGDGGNDVLVADGGTDYLNGGTGNDTVYADDGGRSVVDGGAGTDTAYIDPTGDTTGNVETIIRRRGGKVLNTRLTGTTIGTAGSYKNAGNTASKATDGNPNTFFDAPTAGGAFVGLDLGSAKAVSQIEFAPRAGYESRMLGGVFQASNSATFATATTVYTVSATPASGSLTTVNTGTRHGLPVLAVRRPGQLVLQHRRVPTVRHLTRRKAVERYCV